MKYIRNLLLLLLGCVFILFLFFEARDLVNIGESRFFVMRGSPTPLYMLARVDFQEIRLMMVTETDGHYPKGEIIAQKISEITLDTDQSLKRYGISALRSKRTNAVYLYTHKITEAQLSENVKEKGDLDHIYAVSTSLHKDPKGTYHPFRTQYGEEHWLILTSYGHLFVKSSIPPIPGCVYSHKDKTVYFPEAIIPILNEFYPDANVPKELFIQK